MQSFSPCSATRLLCRYRQSIKYPRLGASPTTLQHPRRRFSTPRSSSASGLAGRAQNADAGGGTGFFSWYSKKLDESPLTIKIVSSALIAAAGDLLCQVLENNIGVNSQDDRNDNDNSVHDVLKAGDNLPHEVISEKKSEEGNRQQQQDENPENAKQSKITAVNTEIDWYRTGRFLLIGAFWVAPATHLWYGFLSTRLVPGMATPKRVVQRLFLDQFGAAPIFAPTFMGLLWLLEGKSPSEVKTDIIKAGPTLVTSNWKLWIPAMGFMFSFVPLKFQVVYSNFVGLVWTVYLSYASTRLSSNPTEQKVL